MKHGVVQASKVGGLDLKISTAEASIAVLIGVTQFLSLRFQTEPGLDHVLVACFKSRGGGRSKTNNGIMYTSFFFNYL